MRSLDHDSPGEENQSGKESILDLSVYGSGNAHRAQAQDAHGPARRRQQDGHGGAMRQPPVQVVGGVGPQVLHDDARQLPGRPQRQDAGPALGGINQHLHRHDRQQQKSPLQVPRNQSSRQRAQGSGDGGGQQQHDRHRTRVGELVADRDQDEAAVEQADDPPEPEHREVATQQQGCGWSSTHSEAAVH